MDNKFLKYIKENNAILILALVLIAAVLSASPKFIKTSNVFNLFQSIGTYGILAAGLSFVFLVGGIDLSIGYQVAFSGTVFAMLGNSIGISQSLFLTLLIGCTLGYINGTIVTRLKIPPLIGTLAVMTALKGFVLLLNGNTGGQSVSDLAIFGMGLTSFYNLKVFSIFAPSVILALILFVGFGIFLKYVPSGANLYVVGGNPEAGLFSGINNGRLTRLAFTLGGFCSSTCAILSVMRLNSSTYNMGDNLDITAICAVVIGGIKMQGGKGNMFMCVTGVAIMQIIRNVMTKLGLHSSVQALVTGIMVILVLIADKFTSRKVAG